MSLLAIWRRLRRLLAGPGEIPPSGDPERIAAVQEVLEILRPAFRADAGDMRLVDVSDQGWVTLRASGSCHGCSASVLTLQGAIRPKLAERCPDWFRGVRVES